MTTTSSSSSTSTSKKAPPTRAQSLATNVYRKGSKRFVFGDAYHFVLTVKWRYFIAAVFGSQIVANALFAILFALGGEQGIGNAHGFLDEFFFSVQTWGTIGYGGMTPVSAWANIVVTLESTTSTLFMAVTTGLIFAKFSRPTARILFAKRAVMSTRDGKQTLMFRLANERGNAVVECTARVAVLKQEITREGERMRRIYDLALVRNTQPIFAFTWTVMHEIDEKSPFFGLSPEQIQSGDMRLTINIIGLDGTMSQTIHVTHIYWPDEIDFDKRYVDVITTLPDGRMQIDFDRFHDVEHSPPSA